MPIAPKTHRAHPKTPRVYDDRYRGTAAERGYDADWARFAKTIRERDCYLCQECQRNGRLTPGKEVDHIVPLHVAPERKFQESNVEVLCHPCHVRKTHQDNRKYGSREGVQG